MPRTLFAVAIVLCAANASADPIKECPTSDRIALASRTAATLHTTYKLDTTDLQVCVDKAVYPYEARRGHELLACYIVALGKDQQRVCGNGNSYTDFHGYRIRVSLRKPRFTESSDVWLQIDKQP